ncbi:MAG: hypothetical protein RLZZ272_1629 [Actinomycetota bacterium]
MRATVPGSASGRASTPVGPARAALVGVLALQGDVAEHVAALERCGTHVREVRRPEGLDGLDAIVLPGGESTTIGRLLESSGLLAPLRAAIAGGLPVFATCAGLILLSDEVIDHTGTPTLGGLAVTTRRNAFGRQIASFDARLDVRDVPGGPVDVSFIRAPRIEALGSDEVEVMAELDGRPVVVRQGHITAMACHPEVAGDDRMLAAFLARLPDGPDAQAR